MATKGTLLARLAVLGLMASTGCKISGIERNGPTPDIQSVSRGDAGFPSEAVLCVDLPGTLVVHAKELAPLPTKTLTDQQGLELPMVLAIGADGTEYELTGTAFDLEAETLTVSVDAGALPPGTYDVVVENPTGKRGTLASGLVVAAPPGLDAIAPPSGPNNLPTPVTLTGSGFRAAGDGTQPAVTLTPVLGGLVGEAEAETLVSDTELSATVPAALEPGLYDVTLTNPEGCSVTLPASYEVLITPIDICSVVNPAFGWIGGLTKIEICANNANGNGLDPIPEVFILVDPEDDGIDVVEVPLIREAFLSASTSSGGFANASVMSAVVPGGDPRGAGLVVGGPYDIKVVNPDGAIGRITDAFELLADPPPTISSVSPEQGDTQTAPTITILGQNFKDPTGGAARILLLGAFQASGAACAGPDCFTCGSPAFVSATEVTCVPPTNLMSAGPYVVRYEHTDDGSFYDYAAFAVTNPSANLASVTTALPSPLAQARFGHAAAFARDDLGNRFIYAIGGQSGLTADTALDTVEVTSVTSFGELGAWATLPVRLPAALSGVSVVAQGSYVFVLGGRGTDDAPVATVHRARVLGSDTAPVIQPPTVADNDDSALVPGTYSYRVSALMAAGGDNPLGETLSSDAESIRVREGEEVQVAWDAVAGAASYRVFRTPVNALAGQEVLLASGITETSFTDDGSAVPDPLAVPQPLGATGVWVPMNALAVPRAEAAATIAADSLGAQFVYVLGGVTTGGGRTNTHDVASLSGAPPVLGSFATGAQTFGAGEERSELLASTISPATAPKMTAGAQQYVVVAEGWTGAVVHTNVLRAPVQNGGALGAFVEADVSASKDRYGMMGVLTNNFYYVISGKKASGDDDKGVTAVVCQGGAPCADPPPVAWAGGNSGIDLISARYRGALSYVGGLFYFIGGRNDVQGVLASVERGSY